MKPSIIVTGAKGLIGANLMRRLLDEGENAIGVDFYTGDEQGVHMRDLFKFISDEHEDIDFVFHLGANTNTLETRDEIFEEYNLGYSKSLWYKCARHRIPIIYASSAATYGNGELGYGDNLLPAELKPLNKYGESKNDFDKFVLQHSNFPPYWAALKFFNVYGHNESHKGEMASMVFHAYHQIRKTGKVRLFKNGQQKRDFIFVDDVVDVMMWMMRNKKQSGIYNVGTGNARTFNDLADAVSYSMCLPNNIEYFEMPKEMIGKYQNLTEADVSKLRSIGYDKKFTTLESGVKKYVQKLKNETKEIPSGVGRFN